ncbi:DUF2007 domain-containing protein [Corallincola luteus]|uniref:DUF2007 domain-containing protein n=1 Tax=Corallincola luteus TaxID=1775177 RepID=A0ABY2AQJ0_9GAMM|nr:DUF2007 domain-containing protein [Corallincola luteus]TCI04043.1 DUF2007 domain-containing protein [Corallincola luteus]
MSALMRLYQAANALEANLLKGMLQAEGFDIQLRGENLAGAAGELPLSVQQVDLFIVEKDYQDALRLLSRYEGNSKTEWFCHHCGEKNGSNFELCWQCGQPKSE